MNRAGTEQVFAVLFAVLMVTSMVAGAVAVSGGVAAAPGDVTHRVNAGGDTVESNDGGPDWTTDEEYLVAGGDDTSSHGQPADVDPSVPDGTPDGIWDEERWDPASGDEMQYEFDVPDGQEVEVRLYFYDGFDGTEEVGDRVFDVSVEDQTIENFDPIEEYGDDTGGMESFTVTSDGTVDVDFDHVTDNPQINAIEIVESEPEPDTLDGPSAVDFGDVTVGDSETEDVTVTNLGGDGDASIDLDDVSVAGADADEFSTGSASQSTLAPGESATIPVTFAPEDAQAKAASLAIDHSGSDSPLEIDLSGEGTSTADVGFSKSKLEGFSAGKPTAIDFGPDGRAYVSTQGGTVYALEVERTEAGAYEVVNEEEIGAIGDIPNHDDLGNLEDGQSDRQITGLTVGGTADEPEVYVSSSDPEISVGQDDDSTDTNSGAISKLTFDWSDDGGLNDVDHEVMVLGLPRSEENHATNGLDLSADEETLYVAQGGHTNKGAPSDNFGHTPEYALSAAILEVDLAQIEENQATSLQSHDSDYPDLDYLYDLPTIQGEELPFGGNNGVNQAELVEDGPVQVYSPGYRNPYDLVVTEDGQVYAADHGPNGGWGGQPADADGNIVADAESVTNHPNEDGSFTTSDELVKVDEGDYGGHAAPIRANPTGADIYDANGEVILDIDESNSPVPESMVNPDEADYIPPTSGSPDPGAPAGSTNTMKYEDGEPILFSPTGGTEEYTASNFGGAMQGDLLQAELGGDVERIELSADGETVTDSETIFNTGGPLGIAAQDDDEAFAGTVWTANHGGNDVTVFEPNDYDDTEDGEQCTGADDPSLDEDGDGYDNADEIDAGSDPCSSASTPADFDDDGTSNLNDPDDDDDGIEDDEDLFAVDSDNGLENDLPATYDFAPSSESGTILDLGFTGVMMNGENYQDLYDPDEVTAGGAANVLTVENVGEGDAYEDTNTQEHAYQVGANADEPFTVETAVNGLPDDAEPFQSQGIYVGTGDQDNYAKLTATGFEDGGDAGSGVQLSTEDDGDFTEVANPSAPTAGSETTLSMTVYPNNGTVEAYYAVDGGEEQFLDETTVPTEWFDTEDGNGTAVGVIATSNGADSTFDATWQYLDVEPLEEGDDEPSDGELTVAEAVASQSAPEDEIDLDEIQTAINWWANEEEVPNTGGETISLDEIQSLINTWSTGATIDDGDGEPANEPPEASFDASPGEPEVGEDVTFDASASDDPDGEIESYAWEFDDGENASGEEVTHAFDDAGDYDVELTVTDDDGDTDTVTETITVTEPPAEGETTFAVNAGGDAYTAEDGTEFQADTEFDGGDTFTTGQSGTPSDPEISNTDDDELYYTERFDDFSYDVPVDDGEYEVTLHFAELFQGVANDGGEGDRVFDASIEGEQVLDEYDIYAEAGGEHAAITETFTVEVTDGELNVDFTGVVDNAKVSAIEVEPADGDEEENAAPSIESIDDQTVTEGESAQVSVNATDDDGDSLSLSVDGPEFVDLTDDGDGTGTLDVAPASGDAGNYTVEVTADDGTDQTTESFDVTVEEEDDEPQTLHRVNVGESETLDATDDGPDWTGVEDTDSEYLVSVADSDAGTYGAGDDVTPTDAVPGSTPDAVFDWERYGAMDWEFDAPAGEEIEVRLYLSNQFSGSSEPGDREFNVSVEDEQVLTNYDPVADVGHANGTMQSFDVTVGDDGTVDLDFEDGAADNPQVNAIEIVTTDADETEEGGQ